MSWIINTYKKREQLLKHEVKIAFISELTQMNQIRIQKIPPEGTLCNNIWSDLNIQKWGK